MNYRPSLLRYILYSFAIHAVAIGGAGGYLTKPASVHFPSDTDAIVLSLSSIQNKQAPVEHPPTPTTLPQTLPEPRRRVTPSISQPVEQRATKKQTQDLASRTAHKEEVTPDKPQSGLGKEKQIPASLIISPKPPYPPAARRAGFEGTTLIAADVLASGVVGSVSLSLSSGRDDCDQSALSTILERWKFSPATLLGQPQDSIVQIEVVFKIGE